MVNNYKIRFTFLGLMLITSALTFAQIPNPGFENWVSGSCDIGIYTYDDPTNWGTINVLTCPGGGFTLLQNSNAAYVHSGSYSAELTTVSIFTQTAPGICATGTINQTTMNVDGGFSINYRPIKLKGFYIYSPSNPDTFSISINLWRSNGPIIGSGSISGTTAQNAFAQFVVNIAYTDSTSIPDSAQVTILNSAGADGQPGTTMYVDDLSLVNCTGFGITTTPTAATCTQSNGSAVTVVSGGNGPYTYAWSNNATTSSISNVAAAAYSVTATDTSGCTVRGSVNIVANNVPFTVGVTPTTSSCTSHTGSVTVNASGGNTPYHYVWNTNDTTTAVNNLGPGSYQVTVTDAHGCSSSGSASVTTPSGPSATDSTVDAKCFMDPSGNVFVVVSGGSSPIRYNWSNSDTTQSLTHVQAGTYTVTISDVNNCSFTLSAVVNQPPFVSLNAVATNVSCYGASTGSVTATASGGTPGYTYMWSNGDTTAAITGVPAGAYSLTIADANGCTDQTADTVYQLPALVVQTSKTDASSQSASDGTASVTISGGTGPYTISWSTGSTHNNITHLAVGSYTVTVTDTLGCSVVDSAVVGFTVSINNINNPVAKLYPNPANSQLVVDMGSASGKYLFTVYGVDGRIVSEETISGKSYISVAQLTPGLYTYRLKDVQTSGISYGKFEIQR